MNGLLYLMIVLVCPLMMFFMMRGMGGMSGGGHGSGDDHSAESSPTSLDRDARIAELEREVAELRSSHRDRTNASRP